jgi:hypothetical protein
MKNTESDYDKLLQVIEYRKDGHFYHKLGNKFREVGDKFGYINAQVYVFVKLGKRNLLAHRAAFYSHYGYLPECIDHINNNKADNRIENLRECTFSQNSHNAKLSKSNTTGVKGVSFHKSSGKYQVQVWRKNKNINGGIYPTIKEAEAAAISLREELHGNFVNHG